MRLCKDWEERHRVAAPSAPRTVRNSRHLDIQLSSLLRLLSSAPVTLQLKPGYQDRQ